MKGTVYKDIFFLEGRCPFSYNSLPITRDKMHWMDFEPHMETQLRIRRQVMASFVNKMENRSMRNKTVHRNTFCQERPSIFQYM